MIPLALPAAIRIGIDPIAFSLGPITIRWYGLLYVVAILVGVKVCERVYRYFGADEDHLWSMLPWCIAAGLLGGRLFYVAQNNQEYYLNNPQHILAAWEGGMAFFGAIGAVALTILIYARINHINPWPLLDVAAIFAAVGQPIGRIGNIINGDIVGYPTDLPWGFVYTHPNSLAPALGVAYQPAPVYQIIANVLVLGVLYVVLRRFRPPGLATCLYLAGYALTQFVVFFWRDNSIVGLGLKQAQFTSIIVFIVSLVLLWFVLNVWKRAESYEPAGDR